MITDFGKYKIAKQIGRGGMGTVYRAFDTNLGRMVALKVLSPHLGLDENFVERFRREAKMAANLNHRNIVTIYDMGAAGNQYYIAMEYVEGPNLRDEIKTAGRLSPARAAGILTQLAAALDYAHQQGVIHRDIKPSNILIEAEDEVKLADFGIARALGDSTSGLTGTHLRVGTPHYMSPEQADGKSADARSDIYSLGIVAYEMLTGQLPFTGETTSAILLAQISKRPPSIRGHVPGISSRLERVVFKALDKRPQNRFQTAGEFARALREAVAVPEARKMPVKLVGGIAAAVVVMLLSIMLLTRGRPQPPPPATATPVRASPTILAAATRSTVAVPTATRSPVTSAPTARANTVTPVPTITAAASPPGGVTLATVTPIFTRTPSRAVTLTPVPTSGQGVAIPTSSMDAVARPVLLAPNDGDSRNGRVEFRWQASGPLPTGAAYELVWWRDGESPNVARGFSEPTTDTALTIDLTAAAGREQFQRIYWAVLIVQRVPYVRLTQPAAGSARLLIFQPSCRQVCDTCSEIDPITGAVRQVPCNCRTECD